MTQPIAFLDYQVIDHLHRVVSSAYDGAHEAALQSLEARPTAGRYELWMEEKKKRENGLVNAPSWIQKS
jgi:hypothetical protein